MWWMSWLVGCGGAPAECGVAECADICARDGAEPAPAPAPAPAAAPKGSGRVLTDFEAKILESSLSEIAQGVRPYDAEGIGVCKGAGKECTEFLGLTPSGELPPGKYNLRAILAVPNIGPEGTWVVKYDLECTTTKKGKNGDSTTTSNQSKEYKVRWGGPTKGYRLQPLWTIESPSKYGRRVCDYTVTLPHPDGPVEHKGQWILPDAG